jgi:hypothetical protein
LELHIGASTRMEFVAVYVNFERQSSSAIFIRVSYGTT